MLYLRAFFISIVRLGGFYLLFITALVFFGPANLFSQCSDKTMQASDGVSIIAANTGGICLFCSVTGTGNLLNSSTTDFASINIPAGLGGYGYIRLQLPQTYPAGTRVGWVADVNGGIGGLFSGLTLVAMDNGTVVGTASGGSLFNLLGLGGSQNVNAVFCQPFNQLEIRAGSLVGVLANYRIYYPYITEDCSFPVQCGSSASTEVCGDKIDNDGNGLVDIEDSCIINDLDGDGIVDTGLDTDINDPCMPLQATGYTGYNATNIIWQSADCDSDGVSNGQEVLDNTNPYDNADFFLGSSPVCLLEGIGMSKWYGDADNQNIGDATNDDEDNDDFISFANYSNGNVDISGWELFVDQNGTGAPIFTFPNATVLSPFEEVTIISDWNEGPAIPTNWFDANFASGEGLFEETSNRVTYAILRNPLTNQYLTIHQQGGNGQTLGSGTQVCHLDFSTLVPTDFDGCELIYWNSATNAYLALIDCATLNHPDNSNADGDGISFGLDEDDTAPCLPALATDYAGYDSANSIWQTADCDGDGVINTQELQDGTNPYDMDDFIDNDGDGVPDTLLDTDISNPCIPIQSGGYNSFNVNNAIWQAADCDGDGVSNAQEITNGTDPYASDCINKSAKPTLSKN